MGYSQSALRAGSLGMGAQFVSMTAEQKMDLCDIVPTGYDKAEYEGGSISVQMLDAQGMMVPGSKYFWYDDEDGTAWFDGSDNEIQPGKVMLAPGEALWVRANSTDEAVQSAGQVASVAIDVALRAGSKLVCNPTPVAIPFNDDNENGKFIVPMGYDEEYEGGSISVQKLDAQGMMVPGSKFYWYDDEDGTAWFDGADEEVEGAVLNPGEAIWVRANSANEKLQFPSAL